MSTDLLHDRLAEIAGRPLSNMDVVVVLRHMTVGLPGCTFEQAMDIALRQDDEALRLALRDCIARGLGVVSVSYAPGKQPAPKPRDAGHYLDQTVGGMAGTPGY